MTVVRDVDEIIASLDMPELATTPINKAMAPWVFIGYRHLKKGDGYKTSGMGARDKGAHQRLY